MDPQVLKTMLKEKYVHLHEDKDGNVFALCCSDCGVNTSSTVGKYAAPNMNPLKMYGHLRLSHGHVGKDSAWAIERCKGDAIPLPDLERILIGLPTPYDWRFEVRAVKTTRQETVESKCLCVSLCTKT